MLRQAFMAATVILLLLLVIITPRLVGVQEDISSLPRLILNYDDEEDLLVLFVTSLSGTYLYKALYLNLTPEGGVADSAMDSNTHGLEYPVDFKEISGQEVVTRSSFIVETVAIDRRSSEFDLSLDMTVTPLAEGWQFELFLGEERQHRMLSSQDLLNAPLATLLQRRTAP